MNNIVNQLRDINRKKELLKNAKYFILDLDGTFYLEDRIFEGSLDFLKQVEKMGINYKFFTNNSSKNSKFYVNRIQKMGYKVPLEKMLTSNHVIMEYLKTNMPGKKVFLLGTEYLQNDFVENKIPLVEKDPDIVVVGFDTTLYYEKISKACDYIRNGAAFLAVNPDYNCPVKSGFIPDCGSICAMITASTGVKPVFFGKPSMYTFKYILKSTGVKEEEIVFVGDRLYTDIAIGCGNNSTTILVLTGETKESDIINSEVKPKLVFESLKEVKELLEDMQ